MDKLAPNYLFEGAKELDRFINEELQRLAALFTIDLAPISLPSSVQSADFLRELADVADDRLACQRQVKDLEEGVKEAQAQLQAISRQYAAVQRLLPIYARISYLYKGLKDSILSSEQALIKLLPAAAYAIMGPDWLDRLVFAFASAKLSALLPQLNDTRDTLEKIESHIAIRLAAISRLSQLEKLENCLRQLTFIAPQDFATLQLDGQIHTLLCQVRGWDFTTSPQDVFRAFLVFEGQNKMMLKPLQAKRMYEALKGESSVLIEAIMGSGKTYFGIPVTTKALNPAALVWQLFTPQLIETSGKLVARQTYNTYGLHVQRLAIDRNEPSKRVWLELLDTLRSSAAAGEPVLSTTTEPQSLLLCWLTGLHDYYNKKATYDPVALNAMNESLRIMKAKGIAICDEAHEIYSPKKEVRFPIGKKAALDPMVIAQMAEIFSLFQQIAHKRRLQEPSFASSPFLPPYASGNGSISDSMARDFLDDLKNGSAFGIDETKCYQRYTKPIAQAIAEDISQLLESPDIGFKQDLASFLTDLTVESERIKNFKISHSCEYKKLCLYRGLLAVYIPSALKGAVTVTFGPKVSDPLHPAIPYQSAGMPSINSVIKYPLEALSKTFIMHASLGVPLQQAKEELIALARSYFNHASDRANMSGWRFLQRLIKEAGSMQILKGALNGIDDARFNELAKAYQHDADLIGSFIFRRVAPNIEVWPLSISCNPQLFSTLFAKQVADTGTAGIEGIYPLDMKLQRDFSANGEAIITLLSKTRSVKCLSSNTPRLILNEILNFLQSDRAGGVLTRAIIDGGALLRGLKAQTVAQEIGQIMADRIDCVFFYDISRLYAWDIKRCERVLAESIYVDPSRRFTIYDHSHTFGEDIEQAPNAHALLLIGPDLNLQDLQQQAFRMRNLKEGVDIQGGQSHQMGQTLTMVLSANTQELICAQNQNASIDVKSVIAQAFRGNIKLSENLNLEAYLQRLRAVVPIQCIDRLLAEEDLDKRAQLMACYEHILCETQKTDPEEMFSGITDENRPAEVFRQMRKTELDKVKAIKKIESVDNTLDIMLIENRLDEIEAQAQNLLLPLNIRTRSGAAFQTDIASIQELAQELEQQQQIAIGQDRCEHRDEIRWSISDNFYQSSWLTTKNYSSVIKCNDKVVLGPPLNQLQALLKGDPLMSDHADIFDERLYLTHNLLPVGSAQGPKQLKLDQRSCRAVLIFVIKRGDELDISHVIALATSEIQLWAQAIKDTPPRDNLEAVVFDLHTGLFICRHTGSTWPQLSDSKQLQRLSVELAVALGYCNFDKDSYLFKGLKAWVGHRGWGYKRVANAISACLARTLGTHMNTSKIDSALQQINPELDRSSLDLAAQVN